MLIDQYKRKIDYIRIAVTDKCNLRCFYCMPHEGINFVKKEELMTYEELLRLVTLLSKEGVEKIRLTGGEPFLRKDIMSFIKALSKIPNINKIAITTNGTHTLKYLDELQSIGVDSFNLSIDCLDKERFFNITRRDLYDDVWGCYREMVKRKLDLKLNCVVMKDRNIEDLIPMVELTRKDPVSVRFIEEMPFNGGGHSYENLEWNYPTILKHITDHFGKVEKIADGKNSTSLNYKVDGFNGSFGIIPAYSRTFCHTCNRLRLTPQGKIKTCLYDDGVFDLKSMMRAGAKDDQVLAAVKDAVFNKYKDGFESERNRNSQSSTFESMTSIGG